MSTVSRQSRGITECHYFDLLAKRQPSIYLAGPTDTRDGTKAWHDQALRYLHEREFVGSVCVPTPRGGEWKDEESDAQLDWQLMMLARVTSILVWLPRLGNMTMYEIGRWETSGRMVVGAPHEAESTRDILRCIALADIPWARSLEETVDLSLKMIRRRGR